MATPFTNKAPAHPDTTVPFPRATTASCDADASLSTASSAVPTVLRTGAPPIVASADPGAIHELFRAFDTVTGALG